MPRSSNEQHAHSSAGWGSGGEDDDEDLMRAIAASLEAQGAQFSLSAYLSVLQEHRVYEARDTFRATPARLHWTVALAIAITPQNFSGLTSCFECAEPTEKNSASSQPAEQAKAETGPEVVSAIPEDPGPEPDPGPGMALLPTSRLLLSACTQTCLRGPCPVLQGKGITSAQCKWASLSNARDVCSTAPLP